RASAREIGSPSTPLSGPARATEEAAPAHAPTTPATPPDSSASPSRIRRSSGLPVPRIRSTANCPSRARALSAARTAPSPTAARASSAIPTRTARSAAPNSPRRTAHPVGHGGRRHPPRTARVGARRHPPLVLAHHDGGPRPRLLPEHLPVLSRPGGGQEGGRVLRQVGHVRAVGLPARVV